MRAVSSSSPSVKHIQPDHPVKIESIRPHAGLASGVSVYASYDPLISRTPHPPQTWDDLVEGVSAAERRREDRVRTVRFDIAADEIKGSASSLTAGEWVSVGALRELVVRSERLFVLPIALDYLSRREHGEQEIARKLRRRGFSSQACAYAIKRLQECNYQSDERYSYQWIAAQMRGKGKGRYALEAGLLGKGISRTVIHRVIASYEEDHPRCFEEAFQRNLTAITGGKSVETLDRTTVMRKMTRKGFSSAEMNKFFRLTQVEFLPKLNTRNSRGLLYGESKKEKKGFFRTRGCELL